MEWIEQYYNIILNLKSTIFIAFRKRFLARLDNPHVI